MNNLRSLRYFRVISIFPEIFDPFWSTGMFRRAVEADLVDARALDLRDFTDDIHRTVDDKPYGGGSGMLMKPEPLIRAMDACRRELPLAPVVVMSPQGQPFTQKIAEKLSEEEGLILLCGRYEGIDERVYMQADIELSIGDYVLTGGELAAMVVMDAVLRLFPGVLGGEDSALKDSFSYGVIEHAHYTRPFVYDDLFVPEVLLSGNHSKIDSWREESALKRSFLKRPDLFFEKEFTLKEKKILGKWSRELADLAEI